MNTDQSNTQVVKASDKAMEFLPFGAADKIKLTVQIVQNLIAVPTRSGKTCSEKDALKFMMLCQAQRLNPFAGDAHLVGYDSNDKGPTFSLITAHQAFLKRAEQSDQFNGMTSGIILVDGDQIVEREGDFHLQSEAQNVAGGWAKVFLKNRTIPVYRRIRLDRFNSGFAQWKVDPAGMIVKCAESDALRSAFPTLLGGLYMKEELIGDIDELPKVKIAEPIFKAIAPPAQQNSVPDAALGDAGAKPADRPKRAYTRKAQWPGESAPVSATPPPTAPVAQPANPEPETSYNYPKAIRDLCKLNGVSEGTLVSWLRVQGVCTDDATTLDDAVKENPAGLQDIVENWDAIVPQVKGAK